MMKEVAMSDYVLHELLAEGGMGAVYAGEEVSPSGRSWPIACKVMNRGYRDSEELADLFRTEAETNRRISDGHDGLVNFYLWFRDQEKRDFLIMELVPGCNVLELCSTRERISFDVVRLIARDILDVLAYVHAQDVVHRDISPSNVLISRHGKVKLLDFGLSKSASFAPADVTKRKSEFRGKRQYVSPEVVLGQGADERSDLFSFASMLYEMLTGEPPFGADVTIEKLLAKASAWSVPDLPAGIPEDLRELTMGLLRRHPHERLAVTAVQARDMLRRPDDVDAVRAELAGLAEETFQRGPDARAKTRHRGSFAGVRIRGLFITDGLADGPGVRPGTSLEGRRRSLWRYGAMSLIGVAALVALALAVYGLQRGDKMRPAISAEQSAARDAPLSVTEKRTVEPITPLDSSGEPDHEETAVPDGASPAPTKESVEKEARIQRKQPRSAQRPSGRQKPQNAVVSRPGTSEKEHRTSVGSYSWRAD